MEEKRKISIHDLELLDLELQKRKQEMEHELEHYLLMKEEDQSRRKRMELDEERRDLLRLELSELIQKLDFENSQLDKNITLLIEQKKEVSVFKAEINLYLSILLAIAAAIFTVLPFFKEFTDLPQIVISMSLVLLFITGFWINSAKDSLSIRKKARHLLYQKLLEAKALYKYISNTMNSYKQSGIMETISQKLYSDIVETTKKMR